MVQRFVNTRNYLHGGDRLETVEAAGDCLVGLGLLETGERFEESERRRLVAFREGLRDVIATHNKGVGGSEATAEALNGLISPTRLRASFDPDGRLVLEPGVEGQPVDHVMGRLIVATARAGEQTWERLKVCRNENCRWVFYDASKNRSGAWCDMEICGARHKMRRYRERKSGPQ